LQEAEKEFINAKKPREAIEMYVHQQDWKSALRIAGRSMSISIIYVIYVRYMSA
jgi:hypothetical protein